MEIACLIIIGISIGGLVHTYLLYPLLMRFLAAGKSNNRVHFSKAEEWPPVAVLMSAYNEETVIEEKMQSLFNQDYPIEKLRIFVGSDCSSDRTNAIMSQLAQSHPQLQFYPNQIRQGKPGVINQLAREAQERINDPNLIFIITDASVILQPNTVQLLVRHFKKEAIALVDSNMMPIGMQKRGISRAENRYISTEVWLKHWEGIAWGLMIGPFGGCYAIRASHFSEVPPRYLVDDFYVAMRAFEKGGKAINDLDAICYESVSHEIGEEYRRKSRISAGNVQNLRTFFHLWWPPFSKLNFAFFSHKILRWMGPFFLSFLFIASGILALLGNLIFIVVFSLLGIALFLIPLLDQVLQKFRINILIIRGWRYFLLMNLALLEGFFKYAKGIRTNVWQPPKRT